MSETTDNCKAGGRRAPALGSASLTNREMQVVKRLSEGATVKEIAIELKLSPDTVAFHSMNARSKIGNPSIAVLTRFAIINGLSPLLPNVKAQARRAYRIVLAQRVLPTAPAAPWFSGHEP